MDQDRLGRRRHPGQEKGLRPLHPRLPGRWTSKAIRVAMSESDWERFEALVQTLISGEDAPSLARAHGEVISELLEPAATPEPATSRMDWMEWEHQKTLRLLRVAV